MLTSHLAGIAVLAIGLWLRFDSQTKSIFEQETNNNNSSFYTDRDSETQENISLLENTATVGETRRDSAQPFGPLVLGLLGSPASTVLSVSLLYHHVKAPFRGGGTWCLPSTVARVCVNSDAVAVPCLAWRTMLTCRQAQSVSLATSFPPTKKVIFTKEGENSYLLVPQGEARLASRVDLPFLSPPLEPATEHFSESVADLECCPAEQEGGGGAGAGAGEDPPRSKPRSRREPCVGAAGLPAGPGTGRPAFPSKSRLWPPHEWKGVYWLNVPH
ncbi:hypothetical protein P7K49_019148 [Saguinus oedipus]|uniref:Uncharacterized protein n=1 Tax=Saguinus oedipus TaxID=9490 RepID=A0ABQ9UZ25_SAGOE|nr:hypothetical protein P7K49_019148 [Saguinus oedipus]